MYLHKSSRLKGRKQQHKTKSQYKDVHPVLLVHARRIHLLRCLYVSDLRAEDQHITTDQVTDPPSSACACDPELSLTEHVTKVSGRVYSANASVWQDLSLKNEPFLVYLIS